MTEIIKTNEEEKIIVTIKPAYMGGVKLMATIGKDNYILNQQNIETVIKNQIKERGFRTQRTGRQIYQRLTINT
jgi:hypothetical protein